ncbi:MAG TPA: serine/threonine-protein kinase [Candidatus Polarisedimenticolia bacterium]|jgi:serine/threonine-protein kinase|nr:serine/threonine-protein kinase [Candidatus Polarisedimenticolia bacterium]
MSNIDLEQWRRLSPILDAALELPPERRSAYLDAACAGDTRLRAAVEALLHTADRTTGFLDRPANVPTSLLPGRSPEGGRLEHADGRGTVALPPLRDVERFLPGSIVGGRYRIVSLLGRGGMGEVYRADDLKLGQPVALKFLPPSLERDTNRVERLLREVRTARQIAHPNVCHVWDVGEHDGAHFLSMEYVDGEALASLLIRIGRLPREKALDVARQICAGLAAAHDLGVVHRDLKPANVMIDGRGRVRIADFGLAGLADEIHGLEIRAGTPGYMAPEQLDGHEVTVRSDVYVLGLVLYELFTGRRAFQARTIAELRRLQEESSPASPGQLVDGLDPVVERAILRCLERDPNRRPASARAVATALPGGDPLEAALAAGETPSPELVAASGPRGALSSRSVLALGTAWLAALALVLGAAGKTSILGRMPFPQSAEALSAHARETLESLGYPGRPADSARGIVTNFTYLHWLQTRGAQPDRWAALAAPGSLGMFFWYRESAGYLVPQNPDGIPDPLGDPPFQPGDIRLWTDLRGRLRFLEAFPPEAEFSRNGGSEPNWIPLLSAAGLAEADLTPVPPTRIPRVGFDVRAAWSGTLHDAGDVPVRFEAAAWRGKPVYFECIFPFDPYWSATGPERPQVGNRLFTALWTAWILIVLAFGGFLVLRNLRLGRADRRGAFHLAAFVFLAHGLWWVLGAHHVPVLYSELTLVAIAVGRSLCAAAVIWCLYVALEPAVRRLWPRGHVGWSRLLAGRFRDPLVGHDLLIGSLSGLICTILWSQLPMLLPGWLGVDSTTLPLSFPGPGFYGPPSETLLGGRFVVAGLLPAVLTAIYATLAVWVLVLAFRVVLRKNALVVIAFVAFWTVLGWPAEFSGYAWTGLACGFAGAALVTATYLRFGLLATAAGCMTTMLYHFFPMTTDASAPYFGTGLVGILVTAGLAVYGAVTSLGGRRLFVA